MSTETVLAVAASSFGVVMGAGPSLQIRRMLREKSSRDVSIGYFAIIAFGSLLWASYGVSLGNPAIVIPNLVGCLVTIVTILVAVRLRLHDGLKAPEHVDADGVGVGVGVGVGGDGVSTGPGDGAVPPPDPQIVWQSAKHGAII